MERHYNVNEYIGITRHVLRLLDRSPKTREAGVLREAIYRDTNQQGRPYNWGRRARA